MLAALSGSGIATAYVIPWSMLPDVIENDQLRTGRRREGSFYAFASFFQKLATGAALWGMGQALARSGYLTPAGAGALPLQPRSALNAIRLFVGPVPTVLLVLAVVFALKYPITRASHAETLRQLGEIESGAQSTASN